MSTWIISSHKFLQHKSLEAAQREAKRLGGIEGKKFHIYRVEEVIDETPDDQKAAHKLRNS